MASHSGNGVDWEAARAVLTVAAAGLLEPELCVSPSSDIEIRQGGDGDEGDSL